MKKTEKDNMKTEKIRQFSFPYNGTNVKKYLNKLEKYKDSIHDVFLALPGFSNYFSRLGEFNVEYDINCYEFLKETKNTWIKRYITLNADYSKYTSYQMDTTINNLINQIKYFKIDGVICTDFHMAASLHQALPELKINTSCNSFHWNTRQLHTWRKYTNVDLVNTPRETGRLLPFLKKVKDDGFKIKLLLNEVCYIYCPYITTYCNDVHEYVGCFSEMLAEPKSIFQSCIILPRWLKYLDDFVSVYKITGRYMETDHIFNLLKLYIAGEDCLYSDLLMDHPQYAKFTTKIIPDKLMHCNLENCHKGCTICGELVKIAEQQTGINIRKAMLEERKE